MSDIPGFERFFEALVGYRPFRWQSRLATIVSQTGMWPAEIGVPTGLGKSTTIEIAVWSLAHEAATRPDHRRVPTRIWYVVNRRLLVDEAHNRALRLQTALAERDTGPVGAVADALRSIQAVPWDCGPLHVGRLRGGADGGFRPPDPSCPAVMLSTVPMYGSRLLFRGYGTGARMRPVDAALAGTDSVVLLDEAHLAQPFMKVLNQAGELQAPERTLVRGGRGAPTLVSLSATGSTQPDFALSDSEGDLDDELVRRRLAASKPLELTSGPSKKMAEQLATTAVSLADRLLGTGVTPAVCVFVNTARRAVEVRKALDKQLRSWTGDASVVALTGRLRGVDANAVRDRLLSGPGNVKSGRIDLRTETLFVIATQTLEVGADLDFDAMVSESAGVRALTQRIGRLNRLGDRNHALLTIVHTDDAKSWPVYGTEPALVWDRLLDQVDIAGDEPLDVGPNTIAAVLGQPGDEPPPSPELLPNHVREWAKTSPPTPPWDPPVEPFVSGEEDDDRRVTVAWRRHLPAFDAQSHRRLAPPIHSEETVEVPLRDLRDLAGDRQIPVVSVDDQTIGYVAATDLRPGLTVVLPCDWGGYSAAGGWDPALGDVVEDASLGLRHSLVCSAQSIDELVNASIVELDDGDERLLLKDLASQAQCDWSGSAWINGTLNDTDKAAEVELQAQLSNVRVERVANGPLVLHVTTTARQQARAPRVEVDDELSTVSLVPQDRANLAMHLELVGSTAAHIATRIGLDADLVEAAGLAGRLHDVGKADPRFQLLLGAESDELMAKSMPDTDRVASLWPRGGRHEAISGQLVDAWLAEHELPEVDAELVQHLVMSHHGYGRPLVPGAYDAGAIPITYALEGIDVTTNADLAAVDWDQPGRFERLNKRYGPWGLALLEAIVRQGDHAESSLASNDGPTTMEIR